MNNPNCGICGHLNQRGYCNLTACIMPNIKTDSIREIKQTKADRIRAMSDEKLANWLNTLEPNNPPQGCDYNAGCNGGSGFDDCIECWIDWLQQEATDA